MPQSNLPEVSHVNAFCKGYNFTPIIQFKHKTDTFLPDAIHESMNNLLLGSCEAVNGGMPHSWAGTVNHTIV
jgi:hypothetical protein